MTRILVCGGRDFDDHKMMGAALAEFAPVLTSEATPHKIIHGDAPGADKMAERWAKDFGVPFRAFPADWKTHGKGAGPIRNQRMIDEGKPDLVIAFPRKDGSLGVGTADMIRRARKHKIPVREAWKT